MSRRVGARADGCGPGSCLLPAAALALLLSACAGTPTDVVTLLPGSEGRPTGGVVIRTERAEAVIREPGGQARVRRDGRIEVQQADLAQVREQYRELLSHMPPRPRTWAVYFESGSDQLQPQTLAVLQEVRAALSDSPAAELVLTGHTDRVGSMEDNDRLSLQRARVLGERLVSLGFAAARIQVAGRGEREPLVPTADEVAEPRNRRVDIKLR
ncbi:MAG: OmpA family protein [Rubrivivax sp.]|nr:OmpA family protein [Rubrivivax sp.]